MRGPQFSIWGPLLSIKVHVGAHNLKSGAPLYYSKSNGAHNLEFGAPNQSSYGAHNFKSGAPFSIIQNQMGPIILNLGPHGINKGSLRAYKLKFGAPCYQSKFIRGQHWKVWAPNSTGGPQSKIRGPLKSIEIHWTPIHSLKFGTPSLNQILSGLTI